jgi:hypothetical protein
MCVHSNLIAMFARDAVRNRDAILSMEKHNPPQLFYMTASALEQITYALPRCRHLPALTTPEILHAWTHPWYVRYRPSTQLLWTTIKDGMEIQVMNIACRPVGKATVGITSETINLKLKCDGLVYPMGLR